MEKISIIIPANNEETFILECLKRLQASLENVKLDYEIILVADNCQDDTVKIAKNFNCKTLQVNFRNRSKARNFGFLHSIGDLLIFLDADTLVSKGFIYKTVETLKNSGKSVIFYKQNQIEKNSIAKYYFKLINWISKYRPTFTPVISCTRVYFKNHCFDNQLKSLEDLIFVNEAFSQKETNLCNEEIFTSIRRYTKFGLFYSLFLLLGLLLNPYKFEWRTINGNKLERTRI